MIVKTDLTKPQAERLFWLAKEFRRETDTGPAARALERLQEALEAQLSRREE